MRTCEVCDCPLQAEGRSPKQFAFVKYCPPCRELIGREYTRLRDEAWGSAVEAAKAMRTKAAA